MTISIDENMCNGCNERDESLCERICPGGLIERKNGIAKIEHPEDCWDCAACIKACPYNAIEMYLPDEIGGKGSTLSVKKIGEQLVWEYKDSEGNRKKISI